MGTGADAGAAPPPGPAPREMPTKFDLWFECRHRDLLLNPMRVPGLSLLGLLLAAGGWALHSQMGLPAPLAYGGAAAIWLARALAPLWQNPGQVVGRLVLSDRMLGMQGRGVPSAAMGVAASGGSGGKASGGAGGGAGLQDNHIRATWFDEIELLSLIGYALVIRKTDGSLDRVYCGPDPVRVKLEVERRIKAWAERSAGSRAGRAGQAAPAGRAEAPGSGSDLGPGSGSGPQQSQDHSRTEGQ